MTQPGEIPSYGGPCLDTWDPVFPCPLPAGSEAVSGIGIEAAVNVLWSLSGRQFGLCTKTLRPCRKECYGEVWPFGWMEWSGGARGGWGWPYPALIRGQWFNLACGSCAGGCSCNTISEAILPGPITAVTEVKVDGEILTPGVDYRVDDFRKLVRLGGEEWPMCNDLNLNDDQPGTWSVTLANGQPVPALGKVALGLLAIEFIKAIMCDATCALPKSVQSIARQGVNVTFLDPAQVFAEGQTGLYVPDLFISTYNPKRLARRARVYDIDESDNRRLVNMPPPAMIGMLLFPALDLFPSITTFPLGG